jgi:FkbM family methyltransferase
METSPTSRRRRHGPFARIQSFQQELSTAWRHPGNTDHRVKAVGRVVTFHARGLVGRPTLVPIGDHSKMWADRRFKATGKLVVGNPPDWRPMQVWRSLLSPGALFIDVGANAGLYSVWAADLGATVISVEPEPEVRKALEENAALNGYTFEVVPAALSDAPRRARLSEGEGSRKWLLPEDRQGGIAVKATTLDDVLGDRTADGVKIDVEGAERLVLEGARRAMAERRLRVIQLEWNNLALRHYGESREPLRDMLAGAGYGFFRPDERGRLQPAEPGAMSRGDVFAVLEEPAAADR